VALAQLLIPVEAVLIGALLLREEITGGMVAGAALVLTAIALNARAAGPPAPGRASVAEQAASPAD
jgi:drug/metabolite transporter (DMT)-like permease